MPLTTICCVCKRTISVVRGTGLSHGLCSTCAPLERARMERELVAMDAAKPEEGDHDHGEQPRA